MAEVINPHVELVDGVARVVDTAFTVADVVAIYELGHSPVEWIIENYPLTRAQVHAALAYYYDHQDEIQAYWRESEALARQLGTPADEALAQMRARLDSSDPD